MIYITECFWGIYYGLIHSISGVYRYYLLDKHSNKNNTDAPVKKLFLKNLFLNGLFCCLPIFLFTYVIGPLLMNIHILLSIDDIWISYTEPLANYIFYLLWVGPLFITSKPISCLWYMNIASNAYAQRQGTHATINSYGMVISDFGFNYAVQLIFLVQTQLCKQIPYVGFLLYFLQTSLLTALYAFEYKWTYMGWSLIQRLSSIEKNWPYFLAYGFFPTIITVTIDSMLFSTALSSTTFPLLILAANECMPYQSYPGIEMPVFLPPLRITNFVFKWVMGILVPVNVKKDSKPTTPSPR